MHRGIGGDKIPEFWGKPSEYTEGTAFLGTPPNHLEVGCQRRMLECRGCRNSTLWSRALPPYTVLLQLIKKRPLSPDVLEIDGKSAHYKFPVTAISSIANRVTGVAMSVGEHTTLGKRRGLTKEHHAPKLRALLWLRLLGRRRCRGDGGEGHKNSCSA